MSRLLLPPSPRLAPLIRYFHLQLEGSGLVRIPATPFPLIGVLLAGQSQAEINGRPLGCTPRCFVSGPFSQPIAIRLSPGTRFISALLRTGQLSRLFPLDCQRIADQSWPLEELAGRPAADALHDALQAARQPWQMARILEDWLRRQAARREEAKDGGPLLLPPDWLFADSRALAERCGLGLRQFERRFLASYGQSLRDTRRQMRFVSMMGLLISRPDAAGQLAGLAADCGYFDQPHMARDFRALSGLTPGDFLRRSHGDRNLEMSLIQYQDHELPLVLGEGNRDILLPPDVVSVQAGGARHGYSGAIVDSEAMP
ncbi:AraC family transcriptional regulator [Chromobacterium subtsugae]|uniref:AraC family transcriptional regulator n=1 Tax=Chromobacterium subtsugae TaxID=251747 RepID=UPI0007F8A69D|nr:helix-turn-helix domain-containing protein [Chromobacterium subtsugae]